MSEPTQTGRGRKAFKTAGIVLASLVGLLLMALVAAYFLAEPLVGRYLKKQVASQTDGLYQLDFRELDLQLHTWGITLHELHFYPDTTVHQQQKEKGQASRSLFEVKSPKLQVSGIHLLDLLFNNRFQVGKVLLERPTITHLLDEAVGQSTSKGDKKSGALDAVRIREIDIQEASYRYQVLGQRNSQHAIPNFSLQVEDLRLDLQAEQELSERLQAAALALDIRGYTYQAPDGVYAIRVGRFSYATGTQELKAENVLVQPDIRANEALAKDKAHRMVYQFSTPLLHLQGLDIPKAWETKQLQLDQLLLAQSSLQVHEDLSVPDTTSFPEMAELYAEYATYLREIGVKELHLATDSIRYHQKSGTTHIVHRLEQASLRLEDLQLDSATLFTPKEKAFAAAVSIATGSYTYSPLHSPYTLQAGGMQLSSRDKTLQADALHLAGDWRKNDRLKSQNKASRTFYDVKLPQLRFREMDLLQAIRTSHLAIGTIEVKQPVIDVRTDRMVAKKEEGLDLEALYEQLSGVLRSLEVGEISVRDAAFTQHSKTRSIQRLQQLEHAALTATGLQLDSAFVYNKDKILPLQDLSLKARNYRYQLPDNIYTFALGDLAYSTRKQELTANSVDVISSLRANERQKLFDNASRKLFDLSASTLQITGLDIIRGLNSGRLEADLLLLRQPNVTMLLDRQVAATPSGQQKAGAGIFELVDVLAVKTIRLEDGSFTLNEKLVPVMRTHLLEHATATVSGFELTPAGLANLDDALPMEELTLLATDYTYQSTDSLYIFRLDSLHYSSRQQELVARTFSVQADRDVNERLKAENLELASHNLIDIEAKETRISGFDLIRAYATGQYHMDKLLLAGPEVTILQDHNVPPSKSNEPETVGNGPAEKLNEMVSTFRVEQVQVRDGTFDFEILQDTTRMSHTLAHVALSIDKLQLVSLEANDPLDIFDVDDIEVLVQGYTFLLPDSLYALEIKQLSASMQQRLLLVDSLHLRPLFSKEEYAGKFTYAHDRIDLSVPGFALHGISLRALFNSQDLVAHKMLIRNPEVEIYRDNSIGIDPERRPPTLQRMLREAGLYIKLDTILVDKKNLLHPVIAINAIKPGVLRLEDIHLELFNVTNDTVLIRSNNVATANMSALFMGASTLQARFAFELDHPEDRYTYEGTLDAMDFTELNPLFENMMFVRIKSGQIGDARFSVESTHELATGMLHFPYTNLKVQLLNKHDPENPGFLLKAGSRLVNALIIKKNNPSAWGNFREGHVKEERDPQRAVFHHMGQSLQDGVVSSLMTRLVERIVSVFVDI